MVGFACALATLQGLHEAHARHTRPLSRGVNQGLFGELARHLSPAENLDAENHHHRNRSHFA